MKNRANRSCTVPPSVYPPVKFPLRLSRVILLTIVAVSLATAASVRSDRWLADVKYLASGELKGRGNGSPELEKAADYIAEQFRKAGLEPLQENYFQPFTAVVGADLGPGNRLARAEPGSRAYRLREDFIPFGFTASGEKTAGVAFVGYGITAPEYNYDDYTGVDVQGKIALVLRHEPQEQDDTSVFRGRQTTRHAEFISKAINARNHGAVALLVVNDPVNHSGREDRLVPFGSLSGPSDLGILVAQVKLELVHRWMQEAGQSLEELQKAIDRDLSNHSFLLPSNLQLTVQTDVRHRRSNLRNVVGYLRGNDPKLRDEVIVIGAHYDHLGVGERDSLAPSQTGQIHHGADDNASGTAGMMELARIFSAEGDRLRRSVLFMAFSGEELGLLGSAHYVQEPLLPIARTVAMLNLDMIGRINRNRLFVGGVGTSPNFRRLVEEGNKESGFDLDFSDSGYDGSDHMSFNRRQVPVMFFFSGLHADYHKPSDTWEKQEPVETARLLELIARVVRRIDAAEERPPFTPVARESRASARAGAGQGGYGPYFGSVPDFGGSVQGVKFADVRQGSPAAQAGLRAGDILVKFDGQEVRSLYDFTYALQGKSPGEEVPVVILRDGQEIQATVKLARRE